MSGGVFREVDGDGVIEGQVMMYSCFSAGVLEKGRWYA